MKTRIPILALIAAALAFAPVALHAQNKSKSGGKKNSATTETAPAAATDETTSKANKKRTKGAPAIIDTRNPAYANPGVSISPIPGGKPAPATAGFIHPGVLLNAAQLAEIKRRVAAGIEPQKTAFEAMQKSDLAALDYKPKPCPQVECGPYSTPDIGCKDEQRDVLAAYTQALLWHITGVPLYAENAIKIMNAWSATLTGGHINANGPVQSAWCAELWPRAAEIIRHTYTENGGWPDAEIARFQNMLRTQYLPQIMNGSVENGNKELAMAEALINMGVFCDDRAIFDLGVKMWRGRVPAAIYLKTDGPEPIQPPGCTAVWSNKGLMPELVDGLLQETARDSGHATYIFAAIVNAAETARQQGLDLYAEQAARITAAMEFHTRHLGPNNTPIPANLEFKRHPTWEIAYNHYHNRLGQKLPNTAAVIPMNRPTATNHMMAWETLTHGEIGAIGLPAK